MDFDGITVPSAGAWANIAKTNQHARWHLSPPEANWESSATGRLRRAIFLPAIRPGFAIGPAEGIFCMGSCFARHIESELSSLGCRVMSRLAAEVAPDVLNKFNSFSMLNEMRWALEPGQAFREEFLIGGEAGFIDPFVSYGGVARPLEAVMALRTAIAESVRQLAHCRVVILTLGLVEAWFDRRHGLYLNSAPPFPVCRRDPDRYELRITSCADNLQALEAIRTLLKRYGHPDLRMVVTVSPVPFQATFSDQDVVVANTYSKSVLRVAAEDFARRHEDVDYLPTYECVMNSDVSVTWETDRIHVTDRAVRANVLNFLAHYLSDEGQRAAAREQLGAHMDRLDASVRSPAVADTLPVAAPRRRTPPDFTTASAGSSDFPAGLPVLSASASMAPEFGPANLSRGDVNAWHVAMRSSAQLLDLQYECPLPAAELWIQAQDRHPERAPTSFMLLGTNDDSKAQWQLLIQHRGINWETGGQWRDWPLPANTAFRHYRLVLLTTANPEIMTIQRVWLAPAEGNPA